MMSGSRFLRMSLWLATTCLTVAPTAPSLAQPAQGTPPNAENSGDPPALAGRLAEMSGTVSYHVAGADQWTAATLNNPVTNGDAYWTEPQASAAIEVGADRLVLDGGTELDISQLDQSHLVATEPQGALYLNLTDLPDGQTLTINTPRAAVQITAVGQYEIVAGDTNNPTAISVVAGSAHVTGTGLDVSVGANQTASVSGTEQMQGTVGALQTDDFLKAQQAHDAPQVPASAPPQVNRMTGGCDLAQYGSWSKTAQYGQVWYPSSVPADWAPYRAGHWAYVAPWGWSWVDAQPWGFAPFHYGRWINDGGRWGWVAVAPDAPPDAYPVYAPALVSFIDVGVGVGGGIGFGAGVWAGGGGIGWVPLGFREPFYPWYHVSGGYLRNINRVSVVNVTNITVNNYRNVNISHFANGRFGTVAPAGALVRGDRLAGLARPLPPAALAGGRPVFGRLPVAPTAATPGLTRAAARRFNVAYPSHPVGGGVAGPQIRAGGLREGRPALRPASMPANTHRLESESHPALTRPPGLPALRPAAATGLRPAPEARPVLPPRSPDEVARHPGLEGQRQLPHDARPAPIARPGLPQRGAAEPARQPSPVSQREPHQGLRPAPDTRPGLAPHGAAEPAHQPARVDQPQPHQRPQPIGARPEPKAASHAPAPISRPRAAEAVGHPPSRPAMPHPAPARPMPVHRAPAAPRPAPHAAPSRPSEHHH